MDLVQPPVPVRLRLPCTSLTFAMNIFCAQTGQALARTQGGRDLAWEVRRTPVTDVRQHALRESPAQ
jgi:hypothetical protein